VTCEIRLHGLGGQGVVTTAHLLGLAATRSGRWAHSFPFFSTAQRGGTVRAYARISETPVRVKSFVYQPDILVVFAPSLLALPETMEGWEPGRSLLCSSAGAAVLPGDLGPACFWLDADAIAHEVLGRDTTSTVMAGALLRLIPDLTFADLEQGIREMFGGRSAAQNVAAAAAGFERCVIREAVMP
jgi:2-oxoisovalerate/pyruvate ferredoxin oxidoreductase gamma subunit